MAQKFRVDFRVYILLALGLLMLPVSWLTGAILAACVHEAGHCIAAKALGVSVGELYIGTGGISMQMPYITEKEELLIAAAGPLGSFLLLFFLRLFPQLAVCGLAQGLFNLLPIFPLDGGRILRCLLKNREALCDVIEIVAAVLLICLGILWSFRYNFGLFPLTVSLLVTGKAFLRKFPCKADELGVQ